MTNETVSLMDEKLVTHVLNAFPEITPGGVILMTRILETLAVRAKQIEDLTSRVKALEGNRK